ncbi:MAG: glycosyl hydrolase family 28-related protein [Limisphaerales bacterium]
MSYSLRQLTLIIFISVSLHSVQANPGAAVPWITYEAEDMTINGGTIIGPPAQVASINATVSDTIQVEASGGKAVELTGTGQYVEFTAQAPANAIVVRYCVPDTASGGGTNYTISLYTNGIFAQKLLLTSKYSWRYGSYGNGTPAFSDNPAQGTPRNFFDEVRLIGLTINAGDTVRIEKDADDTAAYDVIDLVDLENVAAPLTAPANSLDVTSAPYNADTNGFIDSTTALQNCINTASGVGQTVWMPPGNYLITGSINLPSNTAIQGAGMWYTTLIGSPSLYNTSASRRVKLNGNGSNIKLSDFAIVGFLNYRYDTEPNDGLGGYYGTGSTISRIWVEHTKTGIWIENSSGLVISDCRLRDTEADGINLNTGMRGTIVTNCTARGTGDDCFAIWPEAGAQTYAIGLNVFTHCTGQLPFLANGGAIYGGVSNTIEDCAFTDIPYGCGIYIAGTFAIGSGNGFSGLTVAQRCDLTRCGGFDPNGWNWRAALTIAPGNGPYFQNVTNVNINHINITNSLCYAVEVLNNANSGVVSNVTMNPVNIFNYGLQVAGVYGIWAGPWNGNDVAGSINIEGLTVNGNAITSMPVSGTAVVNQSPNFTFNFIPAPTITPTMSGDVLQLSWLANYTGWTLQAQTNEPGDGISPNWSIVSGSTTTNQFSTTLDNNTGSMFFRLIDL